ncbi:MAG: ATP synthase F1 subunit gamma [Patescibacteria group bacterium]
MALSPRLIRRRIKSVANTRKITKAMELVAASKMRRTVQLTQASRPYSTSLEAMVADVRRLIDPASHPLLAGRPEAKASLVVVAASDRGLCGGFNSQVLKKTMEFLRSRQEHDIRVVTVGRRAEASVRRAGYKIVAAFDAISNAPNFERTQPIGEFIYNEFIKGNVDRVFMVYTDFKSPVSQIPNTMQLLPIIPEAELVGQELMQEPMEEERDEEEGYFKRNTAEEELNESPVLFEPNPEKVLDALLPRLLETQVYQALLESSASEHSARMLAMRNATDNASDMLQDLTLTFNQARQAGITREISEISAGKAAIE